MLGSAARIEKSEKRSSSQTTRSSGTKETQLGMESSSSAMAGKSFATSRRVASETKPEDVMRACANASPDWVPASRGLARKHDARSMAEALGVHPAKPEA